MDGKLRLICKNTISRFLIGQFWSRDRNTYTSLVEFANYRSRQKLQVNKRLQRKNRKFENIVCQFGHVTKTGQSRSEIFCSSILTE